MSREERIRDEARAWLVRLSEGDATEADRAAFARWRAADPRHDEAVALNEALWDATAELGDLEHLIDADDALIRARAEAKRRRPWAFAGPAIGAAAAMAAAVAIVVAIDRSRTPETPLDDYAKTAETKVAEIRELRLADGTMVTLGARSQIDVAFSDTERRVELVAGEAFFDVAPDKTWPFVVDAGATDVVVVGTKFEMRRGAADVRVAVMEGVVRVNHRAKPSSDPSADLSAGTLAKEERVLRAGESITASNDAPIEEPRPAGPAETGAWREGRLIYADTPLSEVIADANRYSRARIEIDPALAGLSVSASFRTDEIDALVAMLETNLPVVAERRLSGRIVVRPAEN